MESGKGPLHTKRDSYGHALYKTDLGEFNPTLWNALFKALQGMGDIFNLGVVPITMTKKAYSKGKKHTG